MNDFDDYLDHVRANVNARKPMTKGERQFLGVYAALLAFVAAIAFLTGH